MPVGIYGGGCWDGDGPIEFLKSGDGRTNISSGSLQNLLKRSRGLHVPSDN